MMPAKRYRRTLSINLAALGSALFMAFGLAACTMPNDAFQELSEEAEEGAKGKGGPGATGDGGPMAGGKKGGSPGAAGDGGASSPGGKAHDRSQVVHRV